MPLTPQTTYGGPFFPQSQKEMVYKVEYCYGGEDTQKTQAIRVL